MTAAVPSPLIIVFNPHGSRSWRDLSGPGIPFNHRLWSPARLVSDASELPGGCDREVFDAYDAFWLFKRRQAFPAYFHNAFVGDAGGCGGILDDQCDSLSPFRVGHAFEVETARQLAA